MYRTPRIVFALLILATMLLSCGGDQKSQADAKSVTQEPQAKTPVSFAAYDIDGNLHQSSEWIGKQPVVLNFWGTWCPPCRKEIPDLVRLYDEYRSRGVEIVSLAVKDTPSKVSDYSMQAGMTWVMLMADQNLMIALKATAGVPTTIFLDRNGNEVVRFIGMRDYNTFKTAFEAVASS